MAFFSKALGSQRNFCILILWMSQLLAAGAKGSKRLQYNILSLCALQMLLYLHVVNRNKRATWIQKHLGKIILSLTIHPAALLAQSRPTCHHAHRSQIALQTVGLIVTFPAKCVMYMCVLLTLAVSFSASHQSANCHVFD